MRKLTLYAKQNRKKFTPAEDRLKRRLQRWQVYFRSQRPFGNYIVDFLLVTRGVVVEVDGEYHKDRVTYDIKRTEYLESLGLKVIRFTNEQVFNEELLVRDTILNYPEIYPNTHFGKYYPESYRKRKDKIIGMVDNGSWGRG